MGDLLDAIDELTKPVTVKLHQLEVLSRGRGARAERVIHRKDPALLDRLRVAISNNMGGGSGAGQAARERTPLDIAALTLYEEIDERIRSWVLELGGKPDGDLGGRLQHWYRLFIGSSMADEGHRLLVVRRWVQSIRDLLEPPSKAEITASCPRCGRMWVLVGHGEQAEPVRALWMISRDTLEESYAICRGCSVRWVGVHDMRALRIALDDAEATRRTELVITDV